MRKVLITWRTYDKFLNTCCSTVSIVHHSDVSQLICLRGLSLLFMRMFFCSESLAYATQIRLMG